MQAMITQYNSRSWQKRRLAGACRAIWQSVFGKGAMQNGSYLGVQPFVERLQLKQG